MINKTQRMNTFTTAYDVLMSIDDDKALRKEKLTLYDYNTVYYIMSKLSGITDKTMETPTESVAAWFTKYGFNVKPKGIGWEISI